MRTLFLVKIPKTASSSLRLAACRHWGSSKIVSDYGPGNRHTSPLVEEYVHIEKDHHLFKARLEENEIPLFTSSAPLRRLRRIFPASDILAFVRNPIERVVSQYNTAIKVNGYAGTLEEFSGLTENRNLQSRYLHQMPLELLGFVGLTERYSESLMLLNAHYGCSLSELEKPQSSATKNRKRKSNPEVLKVMKKMTDSTMDCLLENNQLDMELYENAAILFETRIKLHNAEQEFAHGKVEQLTNTKIQGWAVATNQHEPCKVRVVVNKQCVAVAPASEYQSQLKERNVSRDGYVGFSYKFEQTLAPDDVVSCYIHRTEQLLGGPRSVYSDKTDS